MALDPATIALLLFVFAAASAAAYGVFRGSEPWWAGKFTGYAEWLVRERDRMYERLEPRDARRLIALATVPPAILGFLIGGIVPALLFGAIGGAAPYLWTRYRIATRHAKLDEQLVDAFILMANGLKAGLTLQQAIELAADELEAPASDEFGRLLKELRLGTLIDDALIQMTDRLELPDLELAVHSILTLRESGGNLSETFMTVALTIVERKKIEGKISAMTAEGRYQGIILCCMPFLVSGLLYLVSPEFALPLFTTTIGWLIWTVVLVLVSLGMWLVIKVTQVKV